MHKSQILAKVAAFEHIAQDECHTDEQQASLLVVFSQDQDKLNNILSF